MNERQSEFNNLLEDIAIAKGDLAYIKAKGGAVGFVDKLAKNKYLYFIRCGDAVKIGISSDPNARIETLATGAPGKLFLLAKFSNLGARENECHKRLNHLHIHREWFRYTNEVDDLIKELSN
jgi:hypothetical protein